MGITSVFWTLCFPVSSSFEKWKYGAFPPFFPSSLPPSLQEDWKTVPLSPAAVEVMRHALYSWRLSKKLFTSQYLHNRPHFRLRAFAKQSLPLQILMLPSPLCYKSNVFVYAPTAPTRICGTAYKMYLTKVLLKMGQGPYVLIIPSSVPPCICLKAKV